MKTNTSLEERMVAAEAAIAQLQKQIAIFQPMNWQQPKNDKSSWMEFAGVFQDDPDFQEIMDEIRAERTSEDDSEVDPSYYL